MLDATQIFDGTLVSGGGVTGAAITTTRVSTNVLDLLVARDVGAGEPLGLHVDVIVGATGSTSLEIELQGCATVSGTYLTMLRSPVYPVAQLIAGAPIFRYAMPVNQLLNGTAGVLATPVRYLGLLYTVVGTDSTLTVFSYLNPRQDRQEFWAPPAAYVVKTAAGEI